MAVVESVDSSWEAVPHAALDAHGGIHGLWGGMRLDTWNTILAMKCDDVSWPLFHSVTQCPLRFSRLSPTAIKDLTGLSFKSQNPASRPGLQGR